MNFDSVLRGIHIGAGIIGLILGAVALSVTKRPGLHPRLGTVYFGVVTALSSTGAVLAILDWQRFGFFLIIAIGTQISGLIGYFAARKKGRHWLVIHVAGQGSSYNAMVIAALVTNWERLTGTSGMDSFVPWLIPGFLGSFATLWGMYQVRMGKLPKLYPK